MVVFASAAMILGLPSDASRPEAEDSCAKKNELSRDTIVSGNSAQAEIDNRSDTAQQEDTRLFTGLTMHESFKASNCTMLPEKMTNSRIALKLVAGEQVPEDHHIEHANPNEAAACGNLGVENKLRTQSEHLAFNY